MTKEELARKKGMKLPPVEEKKTAAEALVTGSKDQDVSKAEEKKVLINAGNVAAAKKKVGKPSTRKPGDKQVSFWLDEDLVQPVLSRLKYGDKLSIELNRLIRSGLEKK